MHVIQANALHCYLFNTLLAVNHRPKPRFCLMINFLVAWQRKPIPFSPSFYHIPKRLHILISSKVTHHIHIMYWNVMYLGIKSSWFSFINIKCWSIIQSPPRRCIHSPHDKAEEDDDLIIKDPWFEYSGGKLKESVKSNYLLISPGIQHSVGINLWSVDFFGRY